MIQAADTDGDGRIDYEGGRTDGDPLRTFPPLQVPPPWSLALGQFALCHPSSISVRSCAAPLSGADPIS